MAGLGFEGNSHLLGKELSGYLKKILAHEEVLNSPEFDIFLDPAHSPLLMSLKGIEKEGMLKINSTVIHKQPMMVSAGLIGGWAERWVVVVDKTVLYFKDKLVRS